MESCIFCKIVAGEVPCYKVWEDERHLAFLTRWPNTEGFTVLATKEHHPSDVLALPDDVYTPLLLAARAVGQKITRAFPDAARTGLISEGFGVNHAHLKLVPMHGTNGEWKPIHSQTHTFYETYPGYIASHDGPEISPEQLEQTAKRIREA
jgi:diadenosine tetraphosphate (Ap4A) HIT family hydrolase